VDRKKLTDRTIQALKSTGKRYEVMDTDPSAMGVRVSETGDDRTFIFMGRFPGKAYTRHALGSYIDPKTAPQREISDDDLLLLDGLTLAEARRKTRAWQAMIARGIDPSDDAARRLRNAERQREAEASRRESTFGKVFEAFVVDKLAKERKGEEVERDIRKEFLPTWKDRPVTDIDDLDVLKIINAKKSTAPAQARNLLGEIRRLFGWAIKQRVYGITGNPCDSLSPKDIIGKKKRGQRILDDDELFALWRAANRLHYPYRQAYQLLILTALRLNEAVQAPWTEFPTAVARALRQRKKDERIDWMKVSNEPLSWVITAERMKGENDEARPHLVPLTPDILTVLESLPLFKSGDYLFSTTFGKKPVSIGSKIKNRIDARMLRTLKAVARRRGDDPAKVTLRNWTNHDIRRTVRSNLSRLRVTEEAREAVIAHARPGIKGTYDVYDYADEKREALELWAARLRSIVEPAPPPAAEQTPGNVVEFRGGRK
jgi:hypothetical protein